MYVELIHWQKVEEKRIKFTNYFTNLLKKNVLKYIPYLQQMSHVEQWFFGEKCNGLLLKCL